MKTCTRLSLIASLFLITNWAMAKSPTDSLQTGKNPFVYQAIKLAYQPQILEATLDFDEHKINPNLQFVTSNKNGRYEFELSKLRNRSFETDSTIWQTSTVSITTAIKKYFNKISPSGARGYWAVEIEPVWDRNITTSKATNFVTLNTNYAGVCIRPGVGYTLPLGRIMLDGEFFPIQQFIGRYKEVTTVEPKIVGFMYESAWAPRPIEISLGYRF